MACSEITKTYWNDMIPTIQSMMDEFDPIIRRLSVATMKCLILNLKNAEIMFDR